MRLTGFIGSDVGPMGGMVAGLGFRVLGFGDLGV